ncbi:MAG: hypothetical protein C3F15_02450 [Holophagae bacterium]|nr:MAG: hypothetical protein C3F15_02450 [Holophagae bacterium]
MMRRHLTAILVVLLVAPAALAQVDELGDSSRLPAAAARHADEIAAKQARYQRALALGTATPKGWAPVPEPSPIDVTHYDLDLFLDIGEQLLSGTATIDVTAVREGLRTIELDADLGLRVLSVTLLADGRLPADSPRSLPFSHADDRLAALLPDALAAGDSVTLQITYGGRASRFGDGVNWYSHRGFPEIFTFAEPFGARVWFPCNDRPDDKATVDLTVTAPAELTVASNGLEVDRSDNGDGTATTTWSSRYPVATYLVVMDVSNYAYREWPYEAQDGSTMPVVAYMYPERAEAGEADLAITPELIRVLATRFGEYPFVEEKYGNLTAAFGGGMEHQTLTTIGDFFGDPWMEWLNVHELGHSWWGDFVTCDDWRELWLNESFATYAEFVWAEETYGLEYLDQYRRDADSLFYYKGALYDNPVAFSNTVYDGGGMILHMLRYVVGDEAFFDGLHAYREAFAAGSATTQGFKAAMEAASGIDLDWFFEQWVYGANRPRFQYEWEAVSGPAVRLTVTQEHSNAPYFRTPIDVRIQTVAGSEDHRIWLEAVAEQTLEVPVSATPTGVVLDPGSRILAYLSPAAEPDIDFGRDFPDLDAGQVLRGETAPIVVPVTNTGGSELVISSIESSSSAQFRIAAPDELPLTLAPGEAVDLVIEFTSSSTGSQSAYVFVTSNDPSYPDGLAYLPVTGRSVRFADPTIQASSSANLGNVPIGATGEGSINVFNFGAEPLTLTGTISGDGFALASAIPAQVGPAQSTTIFLRFQPSQVGAHTGTLVLATNDPARPEHMVSLTGTGVGAPRLAITPTPIDLGLVAITGTATATIANTGTDDLVMTAIAADAPFTVPEFFVFPVVLAPGQTLPFPIGLQGAPPGPVRGALTISSNDPSLPRVTVPLSAYVAEDPAAFEASAFPAAASTTGLGDAQWRSRAFLVNPTADDIVVDLRFRPGNPAPDAPADLTLALPAGQQRSLANLVADLGHVGAGGVALNASQPGLVAVSRTYADEDGGTYGQFIPALGGEQELAGSVTYVIGGLAANDGFHSNLGVLNLADSSLSVEYTLLAPDGSELARRTLNAQPFGFRQLTDVFQGVTAAALRGAFLELVAGDPTARYLAFASVVDDGSHDPTLVLPVAVDLASPPPSFLVPVVASNPGANGTMWRSDLSIVSRAAESARIDAAFQPAEPGSSTIFRLLEVPPLAALELEDVVRETFGTSGSGSLDLEPSAPGVAVFSRTYNDDPTGTYGQSVPTVTADQLIRTGEVAVLAGLSSASGFRTNLGITSVSGEDITVTVRAFADDGDFIGELEVLVPATRFVQVERLLSGQFGFTGTAWATLTSVDQGARYVAHASVIDGESGDPIYIPAVVRPVTAGGP